MTWSGLARPALIATALCGVLATRVFVDITPVRVKVVETAMAAVAGTVHVDAKGAPRIEQLAAPFAVIARIRGGTASPELLTIRMDGQTVCQFAVTGPESERIDCAMPDGWQADAGHQIDISGPSSSWTLEYLELATHHGATRGFDLVFVPASFARYTTPAAGWIAVAWLALILAIALAQPPDLPRWARAIHRVLAALVVALLAISVLSPVVSPYLVLLSGRAFLRSAVVLLAPEIWSIGRWLHRGETLWARRLACVTVAAVVLAAYASIVSQRLRDSYDGNYSGFLQIAQERFERNPLINGRDEVRRSLVLQTSGGGYDGQFMYFATYDPFMRRFKDHPATYGEFIDTPPYRFGRIGFSLLTKLASADSWQLYPATMMALILGAVFTCALLLAVAASDAGATPWWGALALVIPGFWQSVQLALPEPVAAAFLLGGYLCAVRSRSMWAGCLFAASLLIRETGIILVICVAGAAWLDGRRRDAFAVTAISVLPIIAWKLYVTAILFPDWGIRSLYYNPNNVGVPFVGIAALWAELRSGRYYAQFPEVARAATWLPVLLAGASGLAIWLALKAKSAAGVAAILFAGVALSLNYPAVWVHENNAQRVTFDLFIMLALLSVAWHRYPAALRASVIVFWAMSGGFVFWLAHDADYVRQAVTGLVL
jgi:hypothetical protein